MPRLTDIEKLFNSTMLTIKRDMLHIQRQVKKAKLKPGSAKDLAVYARLLKDTMSSLRKEAIEEGAEIAQMSEEELKAKVKALTKGDE